MKATRREFTISYVVRSNIFVWYMDSLDPSRKPLVGSTLLRGDALSSALDLLCNNIRGMGCTTEMYCT